jgi:hypothetical protein
MELDQPSAERRIQFEMEKRRGSGDAKDAPKRKLEEGHCNFMMLSDGLVFILKMMAFFLSLFKCNVM